MATQTTNYKFTKPALSEPADIAVINTGSGCNRHGLKKGERILYRKTTLVAIQLGDEHIQQIR